MPQRRSDRRQQILQALVSMLEASPGARITTAKLAAEVGVSEAALYRHFPSKTKMYEALIEFVEETLFTRITLIVAEERTALARCQLPASSTAMHSQGKPNACTCAWHRFLTA
jgi:TetR/AcrR family transcriptional regulator